MHMLVPERTAPEKDEAPAVIGAQGLKPDIARDFGKAAASYDQAARLQRVMGNHLISLLPAGKRAQVTDVGCGTGLFLEILQRHFAPDDLNAVDLSADMLAYARVHRQVNANWLVADAEGLPFADDSQDLIFSNLMIQWSDDPRKVLRECRRVLRPGGMLLCSTLLDGTLSELSDAWNRVDPGRGHVNDFDQAAALKRGLGELFPESALHCQTYRLDYAHPAALMRELRDLGAHHKSPDRRRSLTGASRVRRLHQYYPRQPGGGIVASYEAGFMLARCPAG